MAELQLMIGAGAAFEEGDIVNAFNDGTILKEHAFEICCPRNGRRRLIGKDRNGIVEETHLAWDWQSNVYRFLLQRLNAREARITDLRSDERRPTFVRFNVGSPVDMAPFGIDKSALFNIDEWTLRLRESPRVPVFGRVGREKWFWGQQDFSTDTIHDIWDAIEEDTNKRRTAGRFSKYPLGTDDLKHLLSVPVEDFDDVEELDLVAPNQAEVPQQSGEVVIVRTHKRRIRADDFDALMSDIGTSRRDAEDMDRTIDRRGEVAPLSGDDEKAHDKKRNRRRKIRERPRPTRQQRRRARDAFDRSSR